MLRHLRYGFLPSTYEGIIWPLFHLNGELPAAGYTGPKSFGTATVQITSANYHYPNLLISRRIIDDRNSWGTEPASSTVSTLPLEFVQQLIHPVVLPRVADATENRAASTRLDQGGSSTTLPVRHLKLGMTALGSVSLPHVARMIAEKRDWNSATFCNIPTEELCLLLEGLAAAEERCNLLPEIEASLTRRHLSRMSFTQIASCFQSLSALRHPLSWDLVYQTQKVLAAKQGATLATANLPAATVMLSSLLSLHCRSSFLRDLLLYTYVHMLASIPFEDLPPPIVTLALTPHPQTNMRHTTASVHTSPALAPVTGHAQQHYSPQHTTAVHSNTAHSSTVNSNAVDSNTVHSSTENSNAVDSNTVHSSTVSDNAVTSNVVHSNSVQSLGVHSAAVSSDVLNPRESVTHQTSGSQPSGTHDTRSAAASSQLRAIPRDNPSTSIPHPPIDQPSTEAAPQGHWAFSIIAAAGQNMLEEQAAAARVLISGVSGKERCQEKRDEHLVRQLEQLGGEKLAYMLQVLTASLAAHPTMKRPTLNYTVRHVGYALVPHVPDLTADQLLAVVATCAEVQYKPWELLNAIGFNLHPDKVKGKPTPEQLASAAMDVIRLDAHRRDASVLLQNIAYTASRAPHTFSPSQLAAIVSAFGAVRPALRYHAPFFDQAIHRTPPAKLSDSQLVSFFHGLVTSEYSHPPAYTTIMEELQDRLGALNVGGVALVLEAALLLWSRGECRSEVARLMRGLPAAVKRHVPAMNLPVAARCAAAMACSARNRPLEEDEKEFLDDVGKRLVTEMGQTLAALGGARNSRNNQSFIPS